MLTPLRVREHAQGGGGRSIATAYGRRRSVATAW